MLVLLCDELKWEAPTVGWLKCNVDVGFNNQIGTINKGLCVRYPLVWFVITGAAWDYGCQYIMEAEAKAFKEAIQVALALNLQQVIFKSDSHRVVHALRANTRGTSEFSLIIISLRNLLLTCPNFEVKFIKRQTNSVAYSLVKADNSWSKHCTLHFIPD